MAGGIDWFRWHHGSVTDPKFQLVARKSGASLPDVLAVWAYLLEKASAAEFRGCFGDVDCEAVDCLFGFVDGATEAVLSEMVERKLIADEYIVAWEKRQPRREREGDNSTARVQAFRQKQRQETPGNATERHETPRGEERREELTPLAAQVAPLRRQKRPTKTAIPVAFAISARVKAWAAEHGFDRTDEHLEAFTRKCAANGYRYADWDAALMEAIREDWAKLRGGKPGGVAPPAVNANSAALKRETEAFNAQQDAQARKLADPEEQARIAAVIARRIKVVA